MNSTMAGFLALVAVVLIAVAQMGYYWPILPPQVASEFDFQGQAGSWTSKTSLVLVHAGTMLAIRRPCGAPRWCSWVCTASSWWSGARPSTADSAVLSR